MSIKSSFDGVIAELPGVAVDNFLSTDKRAYFLSHCHRDHTQGLPSNDLKRHLDDNNVFIYTSEVSAAIIESTSDFVIVKDRVVTLKLGTATTVKLVKTDDYQELYVEVTLIPASHCFGSVMFLFRTPNKTVLFTGDFRISANDVSKFGHLHDKKGDPIMLDKMYVDTTFFDVNYENFPKRSDCVDYVVAEIKKWLDRGDNNFVAIHPSARFGYENVFNEIHKQLGVKVYIGEDWHLYRSFQHSVTGVTNDYAHTRIHKCRNRNENFPHKCLPYDTANKSYLFVHLSAMKWSHFDMEQIAFERRSDKRIDVCFPTHCSRSELVSFVSHFSPKQIVGFPNEYKVESCKANFSVVFKPSKRKFNVNGSRKRVKKKRS